MLGDCGGSTSSQLSFVYEKWAEVGNFISGQIGDRFRPAYIDSASAGCLPRYWSATCLHLMARCPEVCHDRVLWLCNGVFAGSGTQVNCVKLLVRPCCLRPGFMIFLRFFVGVGRPCLTGTPTPSASMGRLWNRLSCCLLLMPEATEHAGFVHV